MIDPAYLHERLRYDPETGKLFWREYAGHPQAWNTRYAGKEAFTSRDSGGYPHGTVDNRSCRAHVVIWAMVNNAWPADQIDHEDHDRANNRIGNLRAVGKIANSRNMARHTRNSSGVNGVHWSRKWSKWVVQIQRQHVGGFDAFEDAVAARKAAEIRHGFHPNHGDPR